MRSLLTKIRIFWVEQLPITVRTFLLRALGIFLVWKAFYQFRLIPRSWYNLPLTEYLGKHTSALLHLINKNESYHATLLKESVPSAFRIPDFVTSSMVSDSTRNLIKINDECNGFEMFILFMGFLFCFPASTKRRLLFLVVGSIFIYLVNLVRCVGLAVIYKYHGAGEWFQFSHHYLFSFLTYATIFLIWVLFARNLSFEYAPKQKK